jgi:hypothetical protein
MAAKTDWTLTLYGATVDPATTAYTMATASTVNALADLIAGKKYLWAVITGGVRSWPSTAGQVHPVNVTGFSETVNASAGTRGLTIDIELRGRQ